MGDSVRYINGVPVPGVVILDGNGNVVTSFGGSGSSGSALSDLLLTDASNTLFIARDTGSGALTFAKVADGSVYTPSGQITVADNLATGSDATGVTMPTGGNGIRGWLSGIYKALIGTLKVDGSAVTQPVSAAALPLPAGAAQDGTDGTGISQPTGGVGIRGWLSGIYKALTGRLSVAVTDPNSGYQAMIAAFHNADNQAVGGTSYGLLTGGVDQLINASGNLDRKRGVWGDAQPATGLAAEVPMIFNGTNYDRLRSVGGDGATATGIVQEALALWNGTNYDRAYGDKTNGMFVNVKQLPALPAGGNTIGAVNIAAGQTIAAVTSLGGGVAAENAVTSGSPHIVGGVVRSGTISLTAGNAARATFSTGGQLVTKPYSVGDTDWQYTGALTTAAAVAAKAAGAAGIRNYVTGLQYQNTSATATTILIQDGATTIWQGNAPANMSAPAAVPLLTPLRGTAATALNVNCGTAGANVLMNVQGYQAP